MSEWKEYILEDIIDKFIDYRGKTPKKTKKGIPLITAKVVKKGALLKPNEFISVNDYESWMTRGFPEVNDIVLTTEAPLGEVALIKDTNVALAQRIITLRGNPKLVFNPFLKYFFQSRQGQYELHSRASGTTVLGIKSSVLKKLTVTLPSLSEQKAISEVLSSLDDKIGLLQSQNEILGKMAETLFRQWFLEEAEDTWEKGVLGQMVNVDTGFAFKSKKYEAEGKLRVVRGKNVTIGTVRWGKDAKFWEQSLEGVEKYLLKKWDIVIGMDGSRVGQNRALILEKDLPAILAQRVARVVAKNLNFQPFIWTIIYSKRFEKYIKAICTGTSIPHISQSQILNYEIIIPPEHKIKQFCEVVSDFWKRSEYNTSQIKTLRSLRDTLLPKLMGGTAKVIY